MCVGENDQVECAWSSHWHILLLVCCWRAEVNNKSSHGAMRRQRDTLLGPTPILFSSQIRPRPHVHGERTASNNRLNPHSPLYDKKWVNLAVRLLLQAGTDGRTERGRVWWGEQTQETFKLHQILPTEHFTCTQFFCVTSSATYFALISERPWPRSHDRYNPLIWTHCRANLAS